jgi:anti-sigma factor RsiW
LSETLNHPPAERLEAFVEDSLDKADRVVVRSHLSICTRCQTEVAELQTLFEALSALPEVAPSAGFADRVMAGVRVRRPLLERVAEWIERYAPDTNRGWALTTAAIGAPVLVSAAMVWWILSQPGVSAQNLLLFGGALASDALATGGQWIWARMATSNAAAWISSLIEVVGSLGRGELGLAAVMFATMTFGSAYVLYQNLFRTNARRTHHVSYTF